MGNSQAESFCSGFFPGRLLAGHSLVWRGRDKREMRDELRTTVCGSAAVLKLKCPAVRVSNRELGRFTTCRALASVVKSVEEISQFGREGLLLVKRLEFMPFNAVKERLKFGHLSIGRLLKRS